MLERANLTVGRDDVVANRGKGYHLAEWLVVEARDGTHEQVVKPAATARDAEASEEELLSDRQHWILDQLRDGVKLTRTMVERHNDIGVRQAKRELIGLTKRGMIEFIRKPRPGYYVLRTRSTSKASPAT